jgi:hypothetical protein
MNNESSLCTKALGGKFRRRVCQAITQPMTATQLSRRLDVSVDRCSKALVNIQAQKLVRCVNPAATRSRLFCLTKLGTNCRRHMDGGTCVSHDVPDIDWELYASVCFSHRSEVVRTLTVAMQPSTIKRRAAFRTPGLRMSANNVRDVIRYLRAHDIVRPVKLGKKQHSGYEVTEIGLQMRRLLLQAEARA